jgi:lipoyl-dependent peroxiredoxin
VPRIERRAHVVWQGSSARGTGEITADTGAFSALPYTEPARVGAPEGMTSPEELVAAAHAACFGMSLAAELTRAKAPPERLDVTSTIVMDEVEGKGHRIVESQLRVRAQADVDAATFERVVAEADEGCPLSNLVKGTARVTIEAELEGA